MTTLCAFLFVSLFAQTVIASPLSDPFLPNGETATYRVEESKETWRFTERTTHLREDGIDSYRFEYTAPSERTTVLVERRGMLPFESSSISNGGSVTISSSTELGLSGPKQFDRIMVLSFTELKYLLRGYPFDDGPDIDVDFFSTDPDEEDSGFRVTVRYRGTDTVEAAGREVEAHRLELKISTSGILRVLNALIGKTFFWYSVDHPHYLVAYEGSGGRPGSESQYFEIVEYSGWR